jgi:hypothetical protein
MKKALMFFCLLGIVFLLPATQGFGQHKKSYKPKTVKVRSYTTKKGKYVRSYYRSKPSRRRTSALFHSGRPLVLHNRTPMHRNKAA